MKGFPSVTEFRGKTPVAVHSGVVKVSAINSIVLAAQSIGDAVFNGSLSQLRPMLMTAEIAALGMSGACLATRTATLVGVVLRFQRCGRPCKCV